MEESRKVNEDLLTELKELGFLSLELPEYFVGLQLPLITQVQILQGLSYGDLGVIQGIPDCGDVSSLFRLAKENSLLSSFKEDVLKEKVFAYVDETEQSWEKGLTIHKTVEGYELDGVTSPVRLAQFAD